MEIYIIAAVIFLIVAVALCAPKSDMIKTKPAVPSVGYKLIYTDQRTNEKKDDVVYSKLLKSEVYDIKGKPDFLYQKTSDNSIVPVELKSGKIGDAPIPHKGDMLQLIAYFLIVEEVYGIKPKEGRLIYKDFMFKIKNTDKNKNMLLSTLEEMRNMLETGEGTPNSSFVTCRHCLCRDTVCSYSWKKGA